MRPYSFSGGTTRSPTAHLCATGTLTVVTRSCVAHPPRTSGSRSRNRRNGLLRSIIRFHDRLSRFALVHPDRPSICMQSPQVSGQRIYARGCFLNCSTTCIDAGLSRNRQLAHGPILLSHAVRERFNLHRHAQFDGIALCSLVARSAHPSGTVDCGCQECERHEPVRHRDQR